MNSEGRGPAWANSLFEDNAEFGFGIRLGAGQQLEHAAELLLKRLAPALGDAFVDGAAARRTRRPRPASPPSGSGSPS